MERTSLVTIIYGILLVIGGIMGYYFAGSLASLLMSSIFATLIFLSALGMQMKQKWALPLLYLSLALLFGFFGYRFYATLKFMPSGMMAVVTLAFLWFIIAQKKNKAIKLDH